MDRIEEEEDHREEDEVGQGGEEHQAGLEAVVATLTETDHNRLFDFLVYQLLELILPNDNDQDSIVFIPDL